MPLGIDDYKKENKQDLSQCCGKPKVANYSDEGTGCYLCQGCLGEFIPQEEDTWEEELLKKFGYHVKSGKAIQTATYEELKSFIRSLIQKEREEAYQKGLSDQVSNNADYGDGIEQGRTDTITEILEIMEAHSKQNTYEGHEAAVYKTTMNEVISKLSQLIKKQ